MSEIRREYAPRVEGDQETGYYSLLYVVYGPNHVGTYRIFYGPGGSNFGASRDYHYAVPADYKAPDEYSIEPQPCEFCGGKMAICDGSSMVPVHDSEEDRWREAEMMAR